MLEAAGGALAKPDRETTWRGAPDRRKRDWPQGPVAIPELHETFTVDASAVPANGTRKLRVRDNTPGNFHVLPGYLDTWNLGF
ncbi:hypothetical protein ABZ479_16250 [Streptomyces sp. NPDC005722]